MRGKIGTTGGADDFGVVGSGVGTYEQMKGVFNMGANEGSRNLGINGSGGLGDAADGIGMYGVDGVGGGLLGSARLNSSRNVLQNPPLVYPRKLIDLPEFNGNPEDWPVFSTMFWESSNAFGYSKLENLLRLQKSIKGAARDEVKGLLINPMNVEHVMNRLEFNDKESNGHGQQNYCCIRGFTESFPD